jgi:PAS domain S-box-containing protein
MTAEPTPLRLVQTAVADTSPYASLLEPALQLLGAQSGALVLRGGARVEVASCALSPEEADYCRSLALRLWAARHAPSTLSSRLGGWALLALRLPLAEGEAALVLIGRAAETPDGERLATQRAVLALLTASLDGERRAEAAGVTLLRAQQEAERQAGFGRVLATLTSCDTLQENCAALLAELRDWLGAIDFAAIWLPERDAAGLRLFAANGDWGADEPVRRLAFSEGHRVAEVLKTGEMRETQFTARSRRPAASLARRLGLSSVLHAPLNGAHSVAAVLTLGARATRAFDADERRSLELLGVQLGAQIEADRQLARAAVERERLHAVLDTLPVGVAMFAADGKPIFANRAVEEIWGHAVVTATLEHFNEDYGLVLPDGRALPVAESPWARALDGRGGPDAGQELVVRRADRGGDVPVLVHAAPITDGEGRSAGAIIVYQDISPLREVDRLKDTFINAVSHELRTPITTVRGGALTLLRLGDTLDASSRRQMLQDVADEAERLYRLVEDLLWMTRAQAGVRLPAEPMIAHRFVNKVITELGGQIGNHILYVDIPSDLPLLEAVPSCLEQVLRNLLENAVKFSPRGRKIEIKGRVEPAHPEQITFSVLDRGSGIPAQDMDRVFEPFYRTERELRSASQGPGLGLAVCRRLIELQGGAIWAEPRANGGTAFRFTLPALPEAPE